MYRATVLSSICAFACLSACKSESAPAANATAAPAPTGTAMVDEEAPPPETEIADSTAVPGSPPPASEPNQRKDSKTLDDGGGSLPGMGDAPEPIIQGNLDRDIIRRVVRSNVGDIRDCYNAGLRNKPALAGTLTIDFTIDARGRVEQSKPAGGGEFEDPKVAQCIADAIANWEFPATGSEVTVSYPFTLDPG